MRRAVVVLLLALALAGCGGEPAAGPSGTTPTVTPASPTPTSPDPTPSDPTPSEPARTGTEIVVAGSEFGPMLFDDRDQAIYLFDVETSDVPECYDECAVAWPPVLTEGDPVAGAGVRSGLLGTTERRDGTTQVTYGGHPLYYYAHEGPGEVKCHDVFLNGGNWYVVQPDGDPAP